MRKSTQLFAATAIAAGSWAFVSSSFAQDTTGGATAGDRTTTGDRARDDNNPAARPAPDANDIRKTIATATEAAFTKGGLDDVAERFVDADHKRLNKSVDQKWDDLDGRIAQIQKDWKAKYNQDFKFASMRDQVLGDQFARITEGQIGEVKLAGQKDQPSETPDMTKPRNSGGGTPGDLEKSGVNQPDANSNKTGGGDTNRDPGRKVATVMIPASHGMPELAIPMVHEFPMTWKIDVPDDLDGQQLHDRLLKHLTMFNENKDQWPSDVNDGYRMATHHVMAALFEGSSNIKGQQPAQPGAGSSDNAGGMK